MFQSHNWDLFCLGANGYPNGVPFRTPGIAGDLMNYIYIYIQSKLLQLEDYIED